MPCKSFKNELQFFALYHRQPFNHNDNLRRKLWTQTVSIKPRETRWCVNLRADPPEIWTDPQTKHPKENKRKKKTFSNSQTKVSGLGGYIGFGTEVCPVPLPAKSSETFPVLLLTHY